MIVIFIFIGLWLGLSTKNNPFFYIFLFAIFLIYLLARYRKKKCISLIGIYLIGICVSMIQPNWKSEEYLGIVVEAKPSYVIFSARLEKMYVKNDQYRLEVGDIVSINGEKKPIHFSHYESSFNFEQFLKDKGVKNELKPVSLQVHFANPIRSLEIKENFLNRFDKNTSAILNMLLFAGGEIDEISHPFEQLHLGRLIASSGFFIYLFINSFTYLLSFCFRKKWAKLLSLFLLTPYFVILFPRFALMRIVLLNIIKWINEYLLHHNYHHLQIIATFGIFFLVCDYHFAYQDSFVLGFTMPFAFYYITRAAKRFHSKAVRSFLQTFLLFICFIPFEIKYYHEINLFTCLYQAIFTPFFIVMAVLALLCLYRIPFIYLISPLAHLSNQMAKFFVSFHSSIYLPPLSEFETLIFYFVFAFLLYLISISLFPLVKTICGGAILALSIYSLPIKNWMTYEISFVNVGQGDSTLLRYRNTTILIDTGGLTYFDIGKDVLYSYLKAKRIYKIDYCIITHDDFDHNGALSSLATYLPIHHFIDSSDSFPLTINDQLTLYNYNNFIERANETNNQSLVIGFVLDKRHYLLMGDASEKVETLIIENYPNIECDVLKVGHHGSKSSSSERFIAFLQPEIAIISVGMNYYGHPHSEVIATLEKYDVKIYRTDIDGTITFQNFLF